MRKLSPRNVAATCKLECTTVIMMLMSFYIVLVHKLTWLVSWTSLLNSQGFMSDGPGAGQWGEEWT